MEPGLLNDAKMREEVKYLIEGEEHWDSVSFYTASMRWSIFGRLIDIYIKRSIKVDEKLFAMEIEKKHLKFKF